MPHKLNFTIPHFTSEDADAPANGLLEQYPGAVGWISEKECSFPQEIIFRMECKCNFSKMQFLAHQHMISEKIEIHVGEIEADLEMDYSKAHFMDLGSVSLSDNSQTSFKARELKTVALNSTGHYLKLIFHKNYVNKFNVHNQVALVALTIIGNEVEANNNSMSPDGEGGQIPGSNENVDIPSITQDIAFSMYVDTQIAATIKTIEFIALQSQKDQRYEYGEKLGQIILKLRQAGEHLGKLEIEKKRAIRKENFDKAKLKKSQIEEYRSEVYRSLDINKILENREKVAQLSKLQSPRQSFLPRSRSLSGDSQGLQQSNQSAQIKSPPTRPLPESKSSSSVKTPTSIPKSNFRYQRSSSVNSRGSRCGSTNTTPSPSQYYPYQRGHTASSSPRTPAAGHFTPQTPASFGYTDYDEKTLPALRHRTVPESPEAPSTLGTRRLSTMNETEKKDAAFPLQIFDISIVQKFYSKNYSEKERGIQLLQEEIEKYSPEETGVRADRYAAAVVALVHRTLRDKVYSVSKVSAQTLSKLLEFFIKYRVSRKEISSTFESVVPDLLTKTADNAQRSQTLGVVALTELLAFSLQRGVGGVGCDLTKPLSHGVHPRSALCRANIVEAQLKKIGTNCLPKDRDLGFSARHVIEFGLSALQHQNCDVRKVGERLLLTLYPMYPVAVRKALPLENEPARKNVLFRNLFEQLEELDKKRLTNKQKHPTPKQTPTQTHPNTPDVPLTSLPSNQPLYTSTPGGSSTSSGFSTGSSSGPNVPHICITPNGSEIKDRALSRLNSSPIDFREEEEYEINTPSEPDDRTCVFCGVYDDHFEGVGLDMHYWKSCPMLNRCIRCKQVVEISSLSTHLLEECDFRISYRRCERCTEAIPKSDIQRHVISAACTAAKSSAVANHCPLCHENIPPGETGWRIHLMPSKESCTANPRTKPPVPHKPKPTMSRSTSEENHTGIKSGTKQTKSSVTRPIKSADARTRASQNSMTRKPSFGLTQR